MSNAEQYWLWQQQQPTDVLIVGNQKRIPALNVVYADIPDKRTGEEWEKLEDEIIEKHISQHENNKERS